MIFGHQTNSPFQPKDDPATAVPSEPTSAPAFGPLDLPATQDDLSTGQNPVLDQPAPVFGMPVPDPAADPAAADPAADSTALSDESSTPAEPVAPVEPPAPAALEPVTEPAPEPQPELEAETPAPAALEPVTEPETAPAPVVSDDLLQLKQQALSELTPLVDHLDQTPEEKFRTTMMMIQSTDNDTLIKEAYAAAQAISDEKARAQALLDVINEINYFTSKKK